MKLIKQIPREDGFYMPGEFEPHQGCILIWPKRPGSWGYEAKAAGNAFAAVIKAIAQSEKVYVAVTKKHFQLHKKSCLEKIKTWT